MNLQSPKLFIDVALIFAADVCLGVVAARIFGNRTPLDPDASAQTLRTASASGGELIELRVQSLILRGCQLRDAGRYKEAEPLLNESLALAEEAFGKDALEVAAGLNQLGILGKYDGHFDEAEAAYRRALQITEGLSDSPPPRRHALSQPRRAGTRARPLRRRRTASPPLGRNS